MKTTVAKHKDLKGFGNFQVFAINMKYKFTLQLFFQSAQC